MYRTDGEGGKMQRVITLFIFSSFLFILLFRYALVEYKNEKDAQ